MRREPGVPIAYDSSWDIKPLYNMVEVQLGDSCSGDCCVTGQEYCRTRASLIDDGKDCIVVVPFGVTN